MEQPGTCTECDGGVDGSGGFCYTEGGVVLAGPELGDAELACDDEAQRAYYQEMPGGYCATNEEALARMQQQHAELSARARALVLRVFGDAAEEPPTQHGADRAAGEAAPAEDAAAMAFRQQLNWLVLETSKQLHRELALLALEQRLSDRKNGGPAGRPPPPPPRAGGVSKRAHTDGAAPSWADRSEESAAAREGARAAVVASAPGRSGSRRRRHQQKNSTPTESRDGRN